MLTVADCHNDLLMSVLAQREAGVAEPFGDFWLNELEQGGVTVQVLPIYTSEAFVQEAALRRCLLMIDEAHRLAGLFADRVAIAFAGSDIEAITASGRIALVLAIEGAEPVGRDLGVLRALYRAGIRMLSLTWNRRTMLADGVGEEDTGGRLTTLGRDVVREMEQLGMVLDVSHLSRNGFWDVVSLVEKPFVASHSSANDVFAHPRNLGDDQLVAMREADSLVCANSYGPFLGAPFTTDRFVDHIEHLVGVLGENRVGLGLDFILDVYDVTDAASGDHRHPNHNLDLLENFVRPSQMATLTDVLEARFAPELAGKVASGNLTRFLAAHL